MFRRKIVVSILLKVFLLRYLLVIKLVGLNALLKKMIYERFKGI